MPSAAWHSTMAADTHTASAPVNDVAVVEEMQALRDGQRDVLPLLVPVEHVRAVAVVLPEGITQIAALT